MDAKLQLLPVLDAMRKHGLEGILIGNAAAALHGAPVTTVDFDFMFRDTPRNLQKLKAVSRELRAVVLRPYYPVSKLFRIVNDDSGLQVDFMPVIHGVKSFASLRSRSSKIMIEGREAKVASLQDARATGRPVPVWLTELPARHSRHGPTSNAKCTQSKAKRYSGREETLAALRDESGLQMIELIRRRLAMPVEQRMNFLRKRLPGGGSCL